MSISGDVNMIFLFKAIQITIYKGTAVYSVSTDIVYDRYVGQNRTKKCILYKTACFFSN